MPTPPPHVDPQAVLALPVPAGDHGTATDVRGFLVRLLTTVWDDKEGFDGKRPWGNSNWEFDLYRPLMAAGFIAGELDEYGGIETCDDLAGDRLIAEAIQALSQPAAAPAPAAPTGVAAVLVNVDDDSHTDRLDHGDGSQTWLPGERELLAVLRVPHPTDADADALRGMLAGPIVVSEAPR